LHIASAATGPIGPFATAAIRPRPTPSADYPPRASHFPGGQRLLRGKRKLIIEHGEITYILLLTRNGKLILNK